MKKIICLIVLIGASVGSHSFADDSYSIGDFRNFIMETGKKVNDGEAEVNAKLISDVFDKALSFDSDTLRHIAINIIKPIMLRTPKEVDIVAVVLTKMKQDRAHLREYASILRSFILIKKGLQKKIWDSVKTYFNEDPADLYTLVWTLISPPYRRNENVKEQQIMQEVSKDIWQWIKKNESTDKKEYGFFDKALYFVKTFGGNVENSPEAHASRLIANLKYGFVDFSRPPGVAYAYLPEDVKKEVTALINQ
jgi:hypothetical protein